MTGNHSFHTLVRKGSNLDMSFFSVGDREHAAAFTVESAEAVRVVTGVQAVDQSKISEVIDVSFDGKDDNHSTQTWNKDSRI